MLPHRQPGWGIWLTQLQQVSVGLCVGAQDGCWDYQPTGGVGACMLLLMTSPASQCHSLATDAATMQELWIKLGEEHQLLVEGQWCIQEALC